MKTKTLAQVIGWEPNAALIEMILEEVKTTGLSLEECASKYSLPVMVVPSDHGMISENGETMSVEEFEAMYPFRRIIIIREDI